MSRLLEKLSSTGSIKNSTSLAETVKNLNTYVVPTKVPIINIAFSGDINGGFSPGITVLAGESKTFKSMLSLYALKAFQDKFQDGVCLFYDCEYGITEQYLNAFGIDMDRVIHIPIEHVEQLKFDISKKLEAIDEKDEKVFILVDSIGNLASKKEVEDALVENQAQDMSRAKAIRSLLRIITPLLIKKSVPCFLVNHVYQEQKLYGQTIIPGGLAVTYAANTVFVITKAQEKDGTDVIGHKFTINIHKSRKVKEKSKLAFTVDMTSGINQWSGLLDLAVDLGCVVKPAKGWYSRVNLETNEVEETKFRAKDTDNKEFWLPLLSNEKFHDLIRSRFQYGASIQDFQLKEYKL